ncbi:translation initiation factor IF-2 [Aliarcobacter thereius]|uniref:Translation initiation factor IF-2 n=1 Tax=Aliarcobacter thereius LMG 24486 TaxID=1032240 RepID=A0A1C7WPW2_9BACT|nr:translation initiation factor IF-2 [Aliarcobacter thereius]OCL92137.1 Translation initiation factor IF-2 [Aliarcobacter thereius]OCL94767.1 Translation initiation factor IF-2 [Aliarcobacter thereius LMG 24486]QBF15357.1 translation initiation factor IF-2 [Aliarcobacter thereius LMG 24486]TLS93174.1 translation initiation factor IF-2 [Aliarcobacter thereius]TLT07936.1 translation initiation factor IF-2 [Aliarcobacter thereius]
MSDKVKVFEIAEEAGSNSAEIMQKAKELGIELKTAQASVSFEDAEEIMQYILTGKSKRIKEEIVTPKKVKKEEPKIENKVEAKKEEIAKEEIKKEIKESKTNINNEQDNIVKVMPKRKGLVIIKKRRDSELDSKTVEKDLTVNKKIQKPLSEIFNDDKIGQDRIVKVDRQVANQQAKIKKDRKKTPIKAQEHGKKIEVLKENNEFRSSDDSLLGEEVVLFDMDLSDTYKVFDEPKPVNTTNHSRSSKPAAFGNAPTGLQRGKRKKRVVRTQEKAEVTSVVIPEDIRVYEFAEACQKTPAEVIKVLFSLGMMVTKNDFLKQDELEILGEEFGIEVTVKDALEDVNYEESYDEEIDTSSFVTRPPVVTIMGHVDHGKTSLLDKIRSSKIASGEAGGITQHIASYTITKNGQKITFVDTPGHEAFSSMRTRGANVTDIIIIVVAADDGVKTQTEEVISHAKASGCPIIVAMNKMDKETANPDMVKAQMAEKGMTPVDWGGDIEFIGVSARTGDGIDDLLENILLQAEILELKADPDAKAKATVIESSLEKGRGPVANIIVQNGILRIGDNIVCDTTFGRVKAITNDVGESVKELGLSETGTILGLHEVPSTGSSMVAMDSEKEVRDIATTRAEHSRLKELSKSTKVSLEEMSGLIAEGRIKQLPVIIKADVGGTLEAIKGSLEKIANDEVKVKVVHSAVGGITESDIVLASASEGCIILGFNVRPTGAVKAKAKTDGVEIKTYSIIYDLLDDVKDALSGMMTAVIREENTGQAEVRDTFVVPKIGTVAGCLVTDGKVIRGGHARIIRDGVVTYTGKISSLKRFKDDAKEVANGYECGIMFEKFNDIKVGDFIETFIQIEEKVSIED